jgi:hypothetical protein
MSYSQITSVLDCGMRYRLERVEGAPQTPSWALIGGGVVHSVTEVIDLDLVMHGRAWNQQQIENQCDAQFDIEIEHHLTKSGIDTEDWIIGGRGKEDQTWWRTEAPLMVKRWQDFLTKSQWEIAVNADGSPLVEEDFDNTYDYDTNLVGGVDRVLRNTNTGAYAIVDLKSGREPQSHLQLALYRDALVPKYGHITWGYYFMTRKGELSKPYNLDQYSPTATADIVNGAHKIRELGLFFPKPGMFCGSCSVKAYCPAFGGDPDSLNQEEQSE